MLSSIPFLLFDGNCAEAMTFYHNCLGGELTLTRLADTPMKDQFPKEKHNRLINAHLEAGAVKISAAGRPRFYLILPSLNSHCYVQMIAWITPYHFPV